MPGFFCVCKSEKDRENSVLFIPNLTINLTYLCYGTTKILVLREITKEIYQKKRRKSEKDYILNFIIRKQSRGNQEDYVQIKRQGFTLAFSPNLTMNLTYLCYGPPKLEQGVSC
jgi:2-iminoacetate synthase ThiH